MTIDRLNDMKAIDKAIASAHKSGANAALSLHIAGFNCLLAAVNTGDVRPMIRLYDGLKPVAQAALKAWAVKFGPFKYDPTLKSFKFSKSAEVDVATSEVTGPMDYQKAVKPKTTHVFNFTEACDALFAKAEKNGVALKALDLIKEAKLAA